MAMPDLARRYTVEEVLAFPEDRNRYELVEGELLVTPAPSLAHQEVLGRLHFLLRGYLASFSHIARVFFSPADIIWSDRDYVQPDLFVVPTEETLGGWKTCKTLILAIEAVSRSSARYDRGKKRRLYQQRGVQTYWVVDAISQVVEVWHPADDRPTVLDDTVRWRVTPEAAELAVNLPELFADLPGASRP